MQNISQDLVIRLLPLKPTSNVPSLSFEIMAMIDETLFPVVNTSLFFFGSSWSEYFTYLWFSFNLTSDMKHYYAL
jgi:hypothetical protein